MCRLWQALRALAVLCVLAPSPLKADGNVGCLFSSLLCIEKVEWCYDDFAFGRCIPIYEEQVEEGALFQYDMGSEQLKWFERELEKLAGRGYRWEHAYTQCVLQAMLYSLRQDLNPAEMNRKICDHFVDPKLGSEPPEIPDENTDLVQPDETAYIRYAPTSDSNNNFANEVVYGDEYLIPNIPSRIAEDDQPDQSASDKLRELLMAGEEDSPVVVPFEGSRQRVQYENTQKNNEIPVPYNDKTKKSLPEEILTQGEASDLLDQERLAAHFRKFKTKPPPYSAEYLTSNRFSDLDAEVRTNALAKYKQSFVEKNFPFEYENPGEVPEPRIYFDEDGIEDFQGDAGSGDSYNLHGKDKGDPKHTKNMEYLMNYWRDIIDSKMPNGAMYTEGGQINSPDGKGPKSRSSNRDQMTDDGVNTVAINSDSRNAGAIHTGDINTGAAINTGDINTGAAINTGDVNTGAINTDDSGETSFGEFQDLIYKWQGFMRRERDDVKKPGPHVNAKTLKHLYRNKPATGLHEDYYKQKKEILSNFNHDAKADPSYTYVMFKNRYGTVWAKGIAVISKIEELLGLEKDTLYFPRVDPYEVTFRVKPNSKGYTAVDVARRVAEIKDKLREETGAIVVSTGIGDYVKHPVVSHTGEGLIFGMEWPVMLALVGSLSVLVVGAVVFAVLLTKDMNAKKKMQGLSTAADVDSEATRDYQELCRARMSGKWSGQSAPQVEPPQRIASLSREPEGASPSTRSSTSSWSEEPALTNMDISTGHMVLAYMEDHLRNKDRLDQEWRALCAYEAEPCATVAALKPENVGKNRYADVLPYDHSRVTLNALSNHVGSDYINASTITDHDPRNPAYIAAAGPLAHTAPDFWQMVWEQGSVVMVMLTRLTENGQQLCHRYWPEEGSELYHIYEVHLVSEHIWCDDYLVRSFYLKNQRTGETRTVTQFHFLSWPDNGVPASTKALLEFRRKVNKSYRGRSCPIVVHCSDGAGRTGTYCLIDMVLNRMAKGAKEIDIAATLEHIRDQRARTVATKQQFEFVLMAVAEEVHAILKALPAHLQQLQEKKEKDSEKDKK